MAKVYHIVANDNSGFQQTVVSPVCPHDQQQYIYPRCIGLPMPVTGYLDPCGCDLDSACIKENDIVYGHDFECPPLVDFLSPEELLSMGYAHT